MSKTLHCEGAVGNKACHSTYDIKPVDVKRGGGSHRMNLCGNCRTTFEHNGYTIVHVEAAMPEPRATTPVQQFWASSPEAWMERKDAGN